MLHKGQLEKFIGWLNSKQIDNRPGVGVYEVLQVRVQNQWFAICRRDGEIEHLSVPPTLESLVRQFIRYRREFSSNATLQKIKEVLHLPADCSGVTVIRAIRSLQDESAMTQACAHHVLSENHLLLTALLGCAMSDPGRQRVNEGRWTTINAPTSLVLKLKEMVYGKESSVLLRAETPTSDRGACCSDVEVTP